MRREWKEGGPEPPAAVARTTALLPVSLLLSSVGHSTGHIRTTASEDLPAQAPLFPPFLRLAPPTQGEPHRPLGSPCPRGACRILGPPPWLTTSAGALFLSRPGALPPLLPGRPPGVPSRDTLSVSTNLTAADARDGFPPPPRHFIPLSLCDPP